MDLGNGFVILVCVLEVMLGGWIEFIIYWVMMGDEVIVLDM